MIPDGVFRKSSFSQLSNCLEAAWTTSSASGANGGACVQVRCDDDVIQVRDSKDPHGAVLSFTREEWTAFLAGVRAGEFNLA